MYARGVCIRAGNYEENYIHGNERPLLLCFVFVLFFFFFTLSTCLGPDATSCNKISFSKVIQ